MTGLAVYYETRKVGTILAQAAGPTFVYDPAWLATRGAFAISFLMPLSPNPAPPGVFAPWAANLLPEGSQLKAVGTSIGAAVDDVVSILSEIGRDTAGALSIGKPGSSSPGSWKPVPSDRALERIIEELPRKPFLAGEDGVSMSLAGVQSKIGVSIDSDGRICIPFDGAPSTHILKPDSERLFGGVQNEALCLVLARRAGLKAPVVTTGKAGKRSYFLIARYDRMQQADRWRRVHQEDFCQALGKPPSAKYEVNQTGIKGPTLADMFALTRKAMRAPDILQLLDYVIFNIVVCNTDAHAKNYSLMINSQGFSIAPIYDVMCAAAWDGVTRNLAQRIAGKNRGEHLKRRHWQEFASDCGLQPKRMVARVEAVAKRVAAEVRAAGEEVSAMPAGTHVLLPKFVEAIELRSRMIIAGLAETSPAEADTDTPPARTRAAPVKSKSGGKAKPRNARKA